ncbi:hypothetical protein IC617_08580 [Neiella sp. HB171785]|uniref:Uncharacterized protein n=1 Tax=Neiella litorisoli TaxID=2771431 RepID=A0A8J6QQL8_9GAMM|nr:hypothetical protein [Neiella litorisoli]MBD1389481.1 hypothetical protein [Neiella litorisoli]
MYRAFLAVAMATVSMSSLALEAPDMSNNGNQVNLFMESVAHNCPLCADNLMFVAELRAKHCREPITIDSLRENATTQQMYPFLLALESVTPHTAAEIKPMIAEAVDCADEEQWIAQSRQLWDEHKEAELKQLTLAK